MDTEWARSSPDVITRGPYRIEKSHVRRMFGDPAPVYHAFAGRAFIGVAGGDAEHAKALCDAHQEMNPC